jgi:endo-1,3(4)-beta-glucanase
VSATTGPSDTPISTAAPSLPGGKVANTAPPGPFFQGRNPPYPTDACKYQSMRPLYITFVSN